MAHPEQRRFIELVSRYFFKNARPMRILEVGSYDLNGTVRDFFRDAKTYVGVDLIAGPGVDRVISGHEIDLGSDTLDLAMSCESLQHNPYWFETFQNMTRLTRPGGLVVFTCGSRGRVEMGTRRCATDMSPGTGPRGWDHYMNLQSADFERRMSFADYFSVFRFYYIATHADLYFFGVKKGGAQPEFDLPAFEAEVARIRLMDKERFKDWGGSKRAMRKVTRMPLAAASHLLNEKGFQNFAVRYVKVRDAVMRWVGWKM